MGKFKDILFIRVMKNDLMRGILILKFVVVVLFCKLWLLVGDINIKYSLVIIIEMIGFFYK